MMHASALRLGSCFFQAYCRNPEGKAVLEIGSQNVNGSLRVAVPPGVRYIGMDFAAGPGVDVVLNDPYVFPFPDRSIDYVVSTSCLEHSQMFWLSFLEAMRVLKDDGLLYLNVPSNGAYHPYPYDSWRFYPDSGLALVEWAHRSGYETVLLESFTNEQEGDMWNDFVAVFAKTARGAAAEGPQLYLVAKNPKNVRLYGDSKLLNPEPLPEDIRGNNTFVVCRGKTDAIFSTSPENAVLGPVNAPNSAIEAMFDTALRHREREAADLHAATTSLVEAVGALAKIGAHGISLNESLIGQLGRVIEHGQRLEGLIARLQAHKPG